MKIILLIITLVQYSLYCYAQYGSVPYDEVIKMKDMTLVVKADQYGEQHKEEVKKAFDNCWHFCKVMIIDTDEEWKALKKQQDIVYFGSWGDIDARAKWYTIVKYGGGYRDAYALVPISQHIYPEETNGEKVNESDVYVNFLPLVLMTMNNYLQDVADKKITGDKFKDLQKSAEAYYNSRAPELKQEEILVFPTPYIINKNVTAEKITEKFPYKSRIISFDEYIKAVGEGAIPESRKDLFLVIDGGYYLSVINAADGKVYYTHDNAPLVHIATSTMKPLAESIDGQVK